MRDIFYMAIALKTVKVNVSTMYKPVAVPNILSHMGPRECMTVFDVCTCLLLTMTLKRKTPSGYILTVLTFHCCQTLELHSKDVMLMLNPLRFKIKAKLTYIFVSTLLKI